MCVSVAGLTSFSLDKAVAEMLMQFVDFMVLSARADPMYLASFTRLRFFSLEQLVAFNLPLTRLALFLIR